MVFTLVSAGQEWLNVKWEEIRKERDENALKKQKEFEEAERVHILVSFWFIIQVLCIMWWV